MTNISRRHLFKTATAAGLAVGIPATQKGAGAGIDIRKIPKEFTAGLQSKMVYEPVPAAGIDLNTTGTFEQAASILNEGESINASHWGIMRTVVQGGRITRVKPFEFDYAPSFVLEGLAELPYSEARIHYPMVRESYLKDGPASRDAVAKTALCVFLGRRLSISLPRKFNVCMTPMVRRASMGALTAGSPLASSIKPLLSSIVCSI